MIWGDVAASAVGWVWVFYSLPSSDGDRVDVVCGGGGLTMCSYGRKPSEHGSQAKCFAYRHKAPDTTHCKPRLCRRAGAGARVGLERWEMRGAGRGDCRTT